MGDFISPIAIWPKALMLTSSILDNWMHLSSEGQAPYFVTNPLLYPIIGSQPSKMGLVLPVTKLPTCLFYLDHKTLERHCSSLSKLGWKQQMLALHAEWWWLNIRWILSPILFWNFCPAFNKTMFITFTCNLLYFQKMDLSCLMRW